MKFKYEMKLIDKLAKLLKDAGKQQARVTYKTIEYIFKKFTLKSNKYAVNCQAFIVYNANNLIIIINMIKF